MHIFQVHVFQNKFDSIEIENQRPGKKHLPDYYLLTLLSVTFDGMFQVQKGDAQDLDPECDILSKNAKLQQQIFFFFFFFFFSFSMLMTYNTLRYKLQTTTAKTRIDPPPHQVDLKKVEFAL